METGRELFNKFLRGAPLSRPAFVPLVRGLAVRIGGGPAESMMSDPTIWANWLTKTTELFNFDGVVAGLDFTLLAEACGCGISWKNDRPVILPPLSGLCETADNKGRMKHALEAADRVFQVSRNKRACVAALTGPFTLASQLFGRKEGPDHIDEVKGLVVKATEALCRIRPDVLIFLEGRPLAQADMKLSHRRVYNTLKNIAAYYNIPTGLYLQGYESKNLNRFSSLKMDIYVLGPSFENSLPPQSQLWELGADSLGVGIGIPLDDMEKAERIIEEETAYYRAKGGRGFFFTSFGPATRDVDLEILHKLVNKIYEVHL